MSEKAGIIHQFSGYKRGRWRELSLRLDPERAARVAAFEQRTGTSMEAVLLDALDDIIYAKSPLFPSSEAVTSGGTCNAGEG